MADPPQREELEPREVRASRPPGPGAAGVGAAGEGAPVENRTGEDAPGEEVRMPQGRRQRRLTWKSEHSEGENQTARRSLLHQADVGASRGRGRNPRSSGVGDLGSALP